MKENERGTKYRIQGLKTFSKLIGCIPATNITLSELTTRSKIPRRTIAYYNTRLKRAGIECRKDLRLDGRKTLYRNPWGE